MKLTSTLSGRHVVHTGHGDNFNENIVNMTNKHINNTNTVNIINNTGINKPRDGNGHGTDANSNTNMKQMPTIPSQHPRLKYTGVSGTGTGTGPIGSDGADRYDRHGVRIGLYDMAVKPHCETGNSNSNSNNDLNHTNHTNFDGHGEAPGHASVKKATIHATYKLIDHSNNTNSNSHSNTQYIPTNTPNAMHSQVAQSYYSNMQPQSQLQPQSQSQLQSKHINAFPHSINNSVELVNSNGGGSDGGMDIGIGT